MTPTRRDFAALGLAAPLGWAVGGAAHAMTRQPLVIATGAGTADIPMGSAAAFDLAIHDGADVIAADFVPSRDGVLVALDDHELSAETDVSGRPDLASRKQTRTIGDQERAGWFAEDFTLAELKTLVRRSARGGAAVGRAILTFEEVVAIARAGSVRTARVIGVDAGLSNTAYFAGLDLAVEPLLATAIRVAGYNSPAAAMFVSSAEAESLRTIGALTRARRVFALGAQAAGSSGAGSPESLKTIRDFAEAVAVDARLVVDLSNPKAVSSTPLDADADAAGLAVHAWAPDARFPPQPFKSGDMQRLLAAVFAAGVDAVAGQHAAIMVRARQDALAHRRA
jgi:glycerophosphoryl diester phosphodiesterase